MTAGQPALWLTAASSTFGVTGLRRQVGQSHMRLWLCPFFDRESIQMSAAEHLRIVTSDAGLGFCYETSAYLFSGEEGCGPLLVALDTNIVIDLQEHGETITNGDRPLDVDDDYADDLECLGAIIDLWMMRDIRFLSLPRADDDSKRDPGPSRARRRNRSITQLHHALTFQIQDWDRLANRWECSDQDQLSLFTQHDPLESFPIGADRDLVAEALAVRAHVFLTRDARVLAGRERQSLRMLILSPVKLWLALEELNVCLLSGGTIEHSSCPYARPHLMPDMGKISALISVTDVDEDDDRRW